MTQVAPVYRVRSQQVWNMARDDYLAGEPARVVCRRYDLGISAFRVRARKAGWRLQDQDDPDMYDPAVELEDIEDIDLSAMALSARRRLQLSLMVGEATEALRWLKIFETLSSLAPETPERPKRPPEPRMCTDCTLIFRPLRPIWTIWTIWTKCTLCTPFLKTPGPNRTKCTDYTLFRRRPPLNP